MKTLKSTLFLQKNFNMLITLNNCLNLSKNLVYTNNFKYFSNSNNNKKSPTDPHNFNIYEKIKPSFGKSPENQKIPKFMEYMPDTRPGQNYHPFDESDNNQIAIRNNYPIERESVSSHYSMFTDGKYYHVFNAARYVSNFDMNFNTYFLHKFT